MADSDKNACCCSTDSDCCSDEACADEPFLGEKTVVDIDYLYLDQSICDRCQGTDKRVEAAIRELQGIMGMAGYELVMHRTEIENEELAVQYEFLSSPTVRVNGVDICPEVIENPCDCCRDLSDYDVYCRQFSFNGKLYEVPPTAYVVQRILEIVFGKEEPSTEPFVLPGNIKGFLDGKMAKQEQAAQQERDFVKTVQSMDNAGSYDPERLSRIWAARPKSKPGSSNDSCCSPGCC